MVMNVNTLLIYHLQPVLHLFSKWSKSQLNYFFPSILFTSLCYSQYHIDRSFLDYTFGGSI